MSGRQSAVICQRLNELLSLLHRQYCVRQRRSAAWAAAIPAPGATPPAIWFRSNQQRGEKWVKLLRFAPVLTCRNLFTEFHKDRSEIGECGNLLFLVCARSHRFLKLHVFKLKLFRHVRGKVRVNI